VSEGSSPARVWLGVGAACVVALASAVMFLDGYAGTARQNPDPWAVARQVERFAPLRNALPAPSVLGYYTDVPAEDQRSTALFFSTAYALAPHLVIDFESTGNGGLVAGHFQRKPDLAALEKGHGLKRVADYGRGVYLFRRETRQP
jgi:hypothetical protein